MTGRAAPVQAAARAPMRYERDGLRLSLVAPPPDLAPYLSAYYLTEVAEGVEIEDWLPPEEANLRTGSAQLYRSAIGDAADEAVPRAILSGPTDRATHLRIRGSGTFWGIGLTPAGWARFIETPAAAMANRTCAIRDGAVPEAIAAMLEALDALGPDTVAAAALIDAALRARAPLAPEVEAAIGAVHRRLLAGDAVSVDALAAEAGMVRRTFERFCSRYFGFAPNALLRRQRFLRSLGHYMLDPSMRWIESLDTHYWDQAHFIREFRTVMGMTPGDYAARRHPITAAAVRVTHVGSGVAMQALYHPGLPPDSETGL